MFILVEERCRNIRKSSASALIVTFSDAKYIIENTRKRKQTSENKYKEVMQRTKDII